MKDVIEELKSLRNSEPKNIPKLSELKAIAKSFSDEDNDFILRKKSTLKRLFPEHYSSFEYNGLPSLNVLTEETLFYIFYAFVETKLQIDAYNELIKKGYNFSKTLNLFVYITVSKLPNNTENSIIVFNPLEWKKVNQTIVFTSEFINGLESFINSG